jgi:hypothetical protein
VCVFCFHVSYGHLLTLPAVLVSLYEEPEKPTNALEFLLSHMSQAGPQTADLEALKAENAELKKQLDEVREGNPPWMDTCSETK